MTDGRKDAHGTEGGTGAAGKGARGREGNEHPWAARKCTHQVDASNATILIAQMRNPPPGELKSFARGPSGRAGSLTQGCLGFYVEPRVCR